MTRDVTSWNWLRELDIRIDGVKSWIKHYYARESINSTSALDMQSIELGRQLEYYYQFRKQKDKIIEQYNNYGKGES